MSTPATRSVVSMSIDDCAVAVPIDRVDDVFVLPPLTRVPLASPEVAGLLNLRGKVVTAICLRRKLGLDGRSHAARPMAVGVSRDGESYALIVDDVGDVTELDPDAAEAVPVHLDGRWGRLARRVHRREASLLVELDIDAVLDLGRDAHQ